MIGNDIVDLAQAQQESNWRRRGFLNKLFTAHEQELIQSASDPDVLVWLLWSMKESAYKAVVRETEGRFFAPQQLGCQLTTSLSETVEGSVFYGRTYRTTSSITDRYIASTAFLTNESQSVSQVIISFDHLDYQYQHTHIRKKIKQHCAARLFIPESQIQIHKNEAGIPSLVVSTPSGKTIHSPVSLSHHGHYGAFAITET